jgi:hypothetical protein
MPKFVQFFKFFFYNKKLRYFENFDKIRFNKKFLRNVLIQSTIPLIESF